MVIVGKFIISFQYVTEDLSIYRALEEVFISDGISVFLIVNDAGVILGLGFYRIEFLVLFVWSDDSTHKGEEEHGDQDHHTGHRKTVAEKSFCHQSSR